MTDVNQFSTPRRGISRHPDTGLAAPASDAGAYQRASVFAGVPGLLAEFGVAAERALDGLPLDLAMFTDPERYVPYALATRMLANCAAATGRADFGLRLGARIEPRVIGPAGRWFADAPDVQSAMSGFQLLQSANSRGAIYYLRRAAPDYIFGYGVYDGTATDHDQAYSAAMAAAFSVLRRVTKGAFKPTEVRFSFRRPADVAPYFHLFGAPVRFDQYETGLVLSQAALRAPISGAKSADLDFWRRKAMELAPRSDRPWTDEVRHALRPLLVEHEAFAPAVAARLKIDVRTLGRRLESEGTNFQRVLDDVRYAIARELLAVTDLRIGDVASALSYATQGAFLVAFRRWSGMSPTQWRELRRART